MEIDEKKFIKGFNSGYVLAEHEPELLTAILNNIHPVNSFISGLSFGQKEYELEQTKSQINKIELLRKNKSIEKDNERSL